MMEIGSKMNLQLPWRNIWRNPRRTAVILTAVVIGVWSMIFLGALMRGIVDGMVRNGIATLTGHLQIHQRDYPDDPVVDHRIEDPRSLLKVLAGNLPTGSHWSVRVRVNAVAGNARHNAGVTLVGIDPRAEAKVSFIGTSVTQGNYLQPDDHEGILIGRALAERFQTRLGRKIILTSQDVHGNIASRAFRITGIFQAEMESTEKRFVFVNLASAQKMLKMGPAVSEVAVMLPRNGMARATAAKLQRNLGSGNFKVRTWQQALPLLTAMLKLYDNFILIWFVVVFVAMGFGIVNTTLMAVFERMREFGVLKALGMRPIRIVTTIEMESFYILIFGLLIGNTLGLLSCWALSFNGIDLSALAQGVEYAGMARIIYPVLRIQDIINANLVVLVLGLLVSLYPAVKAARFRPVEALMHT
jgi:ABC-type lipoprotein release transport system permease subunit